jgi:hypothetical protein
MSPRKATLPPTEPFTIVYDLRDPDAWKRARRHRAFWGRLYTDIAPLDNDHVALTFRPSPDTRWRAWEEVRRGWIYRDLNKQKGRIV